jgi:glycolate oxidase subunit GlcD
MLKENKLQSLKALLGKGQVFSDAATLVTYEIDAGLDRGNPEGLVFPQSAEDVVQIIHWAVEQQVPLVARGAGTGLSGGAVADRGGIIVEFSRMNRILDLDQNGRSAVLEPAVVNLILDERVRAQGLYFPPDPASQRASTIGGNVAENSGGPHCFKYGVTSNYVTGLDVVLADGRSMRIGGRALDYPGYDLCGLLTGSEGTLAIITAIHLRLVRNPPGVKTMMAAFDSLEQAGDAVSAIIAAGLVPATMEMMDRNMVGIVEEYVHAGLPTNAGAVLIIEVDGYPAGLDGQMSEVAHLLQSHGGHDLHIAANEEERDKIWYARKSAAGALSRLAPSYYLVDITVPRSRLAETLAEVNQICARYGLRAGHVFHAGDGNLHPLILIMDPQDQQLVETVHRAGREIVDLGIRQDGSISGEHGIGIEKRQYMPLMFSDVELAAMWDVKQVFDPSGLLNPGKIFPLDTISKLALADERSNAEGVGAISAPTINRGATGVHFNSLAPAGWARADVQASMPTSPVTFMLDEILMPWTTEEAAQDLADLSAAGRSVRIVGTAPPHPAGAINRAPTPTTSLRSSFSGAINRGPTMSVRSAFLSTAALRGIRTFSPDDLYITVGAGTPLVEIQSFLAPRRMQVPLASPWPKATIGGLVAGNVNAPLRIRYGSMRDLVICATVVLADGRRVRLGRPVIKNVAGYDLVKVFVGSHGTLGLITDVTLKLTPLPRARRTLLAPVEDLKYGLNLASRMLPQALVASAILLCKDCDMTGVADVPDSPYTLVYTAEGIAEDVQAELEQVHQVLHTGETKGPEPIVVETLSGTDIWAKLLGNSEREGRREALKVRAGVAVKDLAAYVQAQGDTLNEGAFIADVGSGQVYAVKTLDEVEAAQDWLEKLRRPALALEGYAVVLDMPADWEEKLDRWGYRPEAIELMRGLKAWWDPANILNPGGFIVN